ncbi:MAG: hypothetical protein ACK40G_11460 [Cytophagaceae bacterium]
MLEKTIHQILFCIYFLPLLFFFASCRYENEQELIRCTDTLDVSYQFKIKPIIQTNCYPCHGEANYQTMTPGINLEDFNNFKTYAELVVLAINHSPGITPMPKDGNKLNSCEIRKIEAWVNQGKKDN